MNSTSRETAMPRSFLVSRRQLVASVALEDSAPFRGLPDSRDPNGMSHSVIGKLNFQSSVVQSPGDGVGRETLYRSSPSRNGTPMSIDRRDVIANCIRNMLTSGPSNDVQANSTVVWSWATAAAYWQTELSAGRTSGSSFRQLSDQTDPCLLLSPLVRGKHTSSDDTLFGKVGRPSTAVDFAGVDVNESFANLLPARTSGSVMRTKPWRPFAVDEEETQSAATVDQTGTPCDSNSLRDELKTTRAVIQRVEQGSPRGCIEHHRGYIKEEKSDPRPMQSDEKDAMTSPGRRARLDHDQLHVARLIRGSPIARTTRDEDRDEDDTLAGGSTSVAKYNSSNHVSHRELELDDDRFHDRHELNYTPPVIRQPWYDVITESYHLRRSQQTSGIHRLPTSYTPWRSQSLSSSDASPTSLSSSPSPSHQAHQLVLAGMLLSPGFPENPAVFNTNCSRLSSSSSGSSRRSVGRYPPTHTTPTTSTEKTTTPPLTCTYCDKVYTSAGALKMHVRTHTLPCRCPQCGKAFSRLWLLRGHLRTHTGERPFRCPEPDCRRAFADRSNLRAHLRTHSTDLGDGVGPGQMTISRPRRYDCAVCGKTFSRMSLLARHEMNVVCRRTANLK